MMAWAVNFVGLIFSQCWAWMRSVFDAVGAVPYYLAALCLFLGIHAVLIPLRGGRMFALGSDLAGASRRLNKGD